MPSSARNMALTNRGTDKSLQDEIMPHVLDVCIKETPLILSNSIGPGPFDASFSSYTLQRVRVL